MSHRNTKYVKSLAYLAPRSKQQTVVCGLDTRRIGHEKCGRLLIEFRRNANVDRVSAWRLSERRSPYLRIAKASP